MSLIDYSKPTFKFNLQRSVVNRIARLTFPGEIKHPQDDDHVVKDDEFNSPVFIVLDDNQRLHVSYAPVRGQGGIEVGDEINVIVPDDQSSSGERFERGELIRVEEPLSDRMLKAAILEGRAPRALEQTYVMCDFRCAAHTALELGASMWRLPDLSRIESQNPFGDENAEGNIEIEYHRAPLEVSKLIAFKTPEEADEVNETMISIQALIFDLLEKFPDNPRLVHQLLPLGIFVETTVTKTIAEWRNWIVSDSQSYEAFYLKKQLFLQAERVASCLFAGCEKVVDAFDAYEKRLKEKV